MSKVRSLVKNNLFKPNPAFVADLHYEVIMGSFAYGVSNDTSDVDLYGVCVPPKEMVFPHTVGYIDGFGKKPNKFKVTQQHHIMHNDKEYDVAIYSIVKYFSLCADNNPNMIDSLFVPDRCITHMDNIGKTMRENRKLFLHKGAYHRFKGYAYSQMSNIRTKKPVGKRAEMVKKYGYDIKYAYHTVRLLLECEQILNEGDLNLEQNKEILKTIRKGEWTLDDLEVYFKKQASRVDDLNISSKIQHSPDMDKIKSVLMACLEEKYGSIDDVIDATQASKAVSQLEQIKTILRSG